MHALGRLPGFRAERSDEVLGLYNLYTFLRDQFMQRMREVRAAADTGTLWLLPDPSETLKAWAQKDGHEVRPTNVIVCPEQSARPVQCTA
jgi:hypothetical protein